MRITIDTKTRRLTLDPAAAAEDFAAKHPQFALEPPAWRFNESDLERPMTCWPSAWLRRKTIGA